MYQKRVVVAVIFHNGRILLGKKRVDSLKAFAGCWHVIGENVEYKETDEEALIRGVKEETGLAIKVGRYIGQHITPSGKKAKWYECSTGSANAVPGSDIEEVKWVSKEEVLDICHERISSFWSNEITSYFAKK